MFRSALSLSPGRGLLPEKLRGFQNPQGPGKRGHIVTDTMLPTQMFPRLPTRATFVADTNCVSGTQNMFLILFRNILCPQQMFPNLRSPRNIMGNNVSWFVRAFTLLMTKICDFCYSVYDLTKNATNLFVTDAADTFALNINYWWRAFVDGLIGVPSPPSPLPPVFQRNCCRFLSHLYFFYRVFPNYSTDSPLMFSCFALCRFLLLFPPCDCVSKGVTLRFNGFVSSCPGAWFSVYEYCISSSFSEQNHLTSIECFKPHSSELLRKELLWTSAEVNIFKREVAN